MVTDAVLVFGENLDTHGLLSTKFMTILLELILALKVKRIIKYFFPISTC